MTSAAGSQTQQAILYLIQSYHDFNPSTVPVLEASPTPVDFAAYVAASQPVLIRNAVHCSALDWSREAFIERLGGPSQTVQVAVTPDGRADSVYASPHSPERVFKEPAQLDMSIEQLLDLTSISSSSSESSSSPAGLVPYLQSQNSNLSEPPLSYLAPDLPQPPSFAAPAFKGQAPDATNLWIGDHRAVTSLHRDPYENLYMVLKGSKTFTLYPPVEELCLYTQSCRHAQWQYSEYDQEFTTRITEPPQHLPWVMVDPLEERQALLGRFPLYQHARPVTITVQAGELLYLPSSWYHHVQQSQGQWSGDSGSGKDTTSPCIAINWWTDQDYTGEKHVMREFLHQLVQQCQS